MPDLTWSMLSKPRHHITRRLKILELEERKATKLVKKLRNRDCLETLVNPTLQQ